MIFVTVGTQLPFDRLIRTVDELAPLFPGKQFIAQVYQSGYVARNIETIEFVSPMQFNDYILCAELIISHAGIGTITRVAEMQKRLIVFPRYGRLKEHRNDHQLATCKMLGRDYELHIAHDKPELHQHLVKYHEGNLRPMDKIASRASGGLISSIRDFITETE